MNRKNHVRNSSRMIIPLITAAGIILAAVIVWIVIFVTTAKPPEVTTGNNPLSRTFDKTETTEPDTQKKTEPKTTEKTEPKTSDEPKKTEEKPPVPIKMKEEYYNILLCGIDFLGTTSDVMMVFSFDVKNEKINILQVPRDAYVLDTVDKNTERRLNSVFTAGYRNGSGKKAEKFISGINATKKVVEDTFGIMLHRYVIIDLAGFEAIIDAIGGVGITIQQDMFYEDPGQDLYIDLKSGYHVLYGKDALGFVRYRSGYAEGDLGRVDAQKIFLSALAKKLLSKEMIAKIPNMLNKLYDYMTTDMTLSDFSYFIRNGLNVKLENMVLYTTPGQYYTKPNGAVYYSLYAKENLEIINKAFNCMTADITLKNMNLREIVRTDEYDRISTEGKSIASLIDSPPNIIFIK